MTTVDTAALPQPTATASHYGITDQFTVEAPPERWRTIDV